MKLDLFGAKPPEDKQNPWGTWWKETEPGVPLSSTTPYAPLATRPLDGARPGVDTTGGSDGRL